MQAYREEGVCMLLGTSASIVITGSLTMRAYDDFDNLVNLTAKGSEDK